MFDADIIELICVWLRNHAAQRKLVSAYLEKGGLDGWVQVEIADLLSRSFPIKVRVEREVLYREPPRTDKILQTDVAIFLPDSSVMAIQLKAESILQESRERGRLAERYRDDVSKVALFDAKKTNVWFLVCGIAISQAANDAMVRMLQKYPRIQERTQSVLCGRSQEFDITLYWAAFRHLQ